MRTKKAQPQYFYDSWGKNCIQSLFCIVCISLQVCGCINWLQYTLRPRKKKHGWHKKNRYAPQTVMTHLRLLYTLTKEYQLFLDCVSNIRGNWLCKEIFFGKISFNMFYLKLDFGRATINMLVLKNVI